MQAFSRYFLVSLCLVGAQAIVHAESGQAGSATQPDAYRLILEAEAFDGRPHYGNWYSKERVGWYTKEHRHAIGQAVAVCDELNREAMMLKRLSKPVPAGEFKIFLRVVLMRMGIGNSIRLEFGNWKDKAFVPVEELHFQWRLGSGYSWLRQSVDLSESCSHLRVTATRVECQGIGDIPEEPHAKVILDRFIVTNESAARLEPDPQVRGRYLVVLPKVEGEGAEVAEQQPVPSAYLPRNSYSTLRAEGEGVHLDIPRINLGSGSTNLVTNGSFEYSLRPNWRAIGNFFHGYDVNSENLDPDFPTHGRYCLKLPLTTVNYLYPAEKRQYGMGVETNEFSVKPATTYWVSFNARGSQNDIRLSSRLGRFELGLRWKKFQTRITTGENQETFSLNFISRSRDAGQSVWLDEVEVRESSKDERRDVPPAKFDARGQIEVGLRCEELGEVYYDGRPLRVVIVASNTFLKQVQDVLELRVLDTNGKIVDSQSHEIVVAPYDQKEERITFNFRRKGAFLAVYWLRSGTHPIGRLAFNVVSDPGSTIGKRPFIGIYSNSVESAMKLGERIGFDWMSPLTDRILNARYIWKKNKAPAFYDDLVAQWKEYGFDVVGETLPSDKPTWDQGFLGTQPAAGASTAFFKEGVWRQHLENMLAHYKGIKHWILADEAELLRTPSDFAPYVKIANEVARKMNPDARIMFSAASDMMDEIFRISGTSSVQDIFAGTRFLAGKWAYTKDREFCLKYGFRAWNLGVGYPTTWMYDLVSDSGEINYSQVSDLKARLNRQAFDLMLQTSVIEPDRFCHYNGKLDGGGDPYSIYAEDNSFRPHAVQFVNSLQQLRGVRVGALLEFENSSFIEGCYFSRDDWTYAVVNQTGPKGDVRHKCDTQANAVTVLDRNFNPVRFERTEGGISFKLPADELRIIRDISGGRTQFLDAVRRIRTESYMTIRQVLLPSGDTPKIGVSIAGVPLNMKNTQGELTLGAQTAKLVFSDTPQMFMFDSPVTTESSVTNAPLSISLKHESGQVYSETRSLWMLPAPTVQSEPVWLDGELTEWSGRRPIFLYASQATDGSYGTMQARFGGHRVKSFQDSSARVWCRWSTEGLFIAADVIDDNLRFAPAEVEPGKPGDQIHFLFDTDLLGDLHVSGMNDDDYKVVFGPGALKDPRANFFNHRGESTPLNTFFKTHDGGYQIEFHVPWSLLGRSWPNVVISNKWINAFGFDVVLKDADGSTLLKSELAWAGHHGTADDPLAFGQLMFAPGYKDALMSVVRSFDKKAFENTRVEFRPAPQPSVETTKTVKSVTTTTEVPVYNTPTYNNPAITTVHKKEVRVDSDIQEGTAREVSRTSQGYEMAPPRAVREGRIPTIDEPDPEAEAEKRAREQRDRKSDNVKSEAKKVDEKKKKKGFFRKLFGG